MLDARLRLAADWVRKGSCVADIGTDHAYLPVILVQEGRCPAAIASDIRPGPVANARRTVERAGLQGLVSVRLGDGLQTVQPHEADDIVIAGMGGETIAAILADAPWVRAARYRLILQPMTRAERLRAYLFAEGFSIEEEQAVCSNGHWYAVMRVSYTGQAVPAEEALCYVGRISREQGDGYLRMVENRLLRQQRARPTPEGETCLAQLRRYRDGSWTPWEEET